MDEALARRRIHEALEEAIAGRNGLIDHHMRAIKRVGDGRWDERAAMYYIQGLEAQLKGESEATEAGFRDFEMRNSSILNDTDESVNHTEWYRYSM